MKCFVAVLGLLAVANAGAPQVATYSYANPAGVTYRGNGFAPGFAIGPAQPVAAHYANAGPGLQYAQGPAPLQYAGPQQLQYAAAPQLQYAAAPQLQYHQPAVAVTQKVGYAHHQIPVQYAGHADVPVTKQVLTQGVTQKLVDVAQPAVTNRRVKVRRPALRKEFYDIEHRVIVRPAGSATLELSQPISKEQKGPAVLTPTNYQQIAPVVRYGNSRQIIDGEGVSTVAQIRANLARGIQAGPAPAPQPQPQLQQGPAPQLRSAEPQPQQQGPGPQQQQQEQQFRQHQQQEQQQFAQQQQAQQQQFQAQQQQQFGPQQQQGPAPQQGPQPQLNAAPAPRLRPLQLRPQQGPGPQQGPAPQLRSADAEIIDAAPEGAAPQQQQQQFQQQRPQGPAPQPFPAQGARVALPQMPVELQARLLELLSGKGGTVTEVLGQDGRPNSASVLQVADSIQDLDLQGGERITTRRIVVTRPIETIQEVDIQEPATKIHRHLVNTPTLFKSNVQGVARVPVSIPGVKNVATPVLKTHYAAAAPAYAGFGYAQAGPQYAY